MDMSSKQILSIGVFLNLIFLLVFYFMFVQQPKIGYMKNQVVFNEFHGKLELEKRLNTLTNKRKTTLDSLRLMVSNIPDSNPQKKEALYAYQNRELQFNQFYDEQSRKYTDEIWSQINHYVAEFGQENEYHYILGTQGTGNLMYGSKSKDISKEIIEFINNKYEGS